jgi:hypothetical protein
MSDAARVKLYYAEESSFAAAVSGAPVKAYGNALSESFGPSYEHMTTDALRGDYVKPFWIRKKRHGIGGFPFELAYGDPDDFLEGVLRSDWTAAITSTGTNIETTNPGTFTRAAGSFVTDGWVVGMGGRSSGFTTGANNGYWYVVTVAALTMTVTGITLTTEAAGASVTLKNSGMLRNGITRHSYMVERHFSDLTNRWIRLTGLYPGGVNMETTVDNPVRGNFTDFIGKAPATAAASAGNGSITAAPTTRVMNGVDEIYAITEAGVVVTVNVSRLSWDFKGGLEPLHGLTSRDPFGVGANSFNLTGGVTLYLDDAAFALLDKAYNFTASSLWWRHTDSAGNSYMLKFPALRYMDAQVNAGGVEQRTYLDLPWGAELDSTTNSIMQIDRIAA